MSKLNLNSDHQISKQPVYIIIPVYNRKETTLKCLSNLAKSGYLQQYYVAVIDDASTDGTREVIATSYPEVIVLEGNGDLWWTGAMAKGMEYAYQQGAEYFIWLNDDCLPAAETLREMVTFMQQHANTLVAPSCYSETSTSSFKIQNNGFRGRQGCAAKPGEIIYVDGMSGWCVGIPSTVYEKIGAPDAKKFPHYSGDDIYTFQATKAGFQACLIGDIEARLFGPVHENLSFQNYFKPELTPHQSFKALFLHKKSPYRLLTRFFVFQEKYGICVGTFLFMIKFLTWLGKWLKFQFNIPLQSEVK